MFFYFSQTPRNFRLDRRLWVFILFMNLKDIFFCLLSLMGFIPIVSAQELRSPEDFLEYSLGESFTYHHRMVDYFEHLDAQSDRIQLIPYGSTYEKRPLLVAAISSEKNLQQLEAYRKANLYAAGLSEQKGSVPQIPIIWFGFNVHGNESSAMEAAIAMAYALVVQDTAQWLDSMIVLLDPCINPDGRERFTQWYKQAANRWPTPQENSYEHHEPWPGGRYNHYLFDLNRDWAWQSQVESQQRLALYQQWMPQVAVDFHEMGANSPFFFGPAAKPLHEVITPWQRTFQRLVSRENARHFDERGWLYFTHEVYDLLYPSYGDTWPTYNGAVGFTYEKGGSGRAGKALIIASGDTLTLHDRLSQHFIAGWATLKTSFAQKERLLTEFNSFFEQGRKNPSDPYSSYILSAQNNPPERLRAICQLLDKQKIQYGHPRNIKGAFQGFSYQTGKEELFELDKEDIVISSFQSKSKLVQVLMEPETYLEDSITYDLTAWALPYVYNLEAYATESRIDIKNQELVFPLPKIRQPTFTPYAWLLRWEDFQSVRFLAKVLSENFRVRYAHKEFAIGKERFSPGTLIITRNDNHFPRDQEKLLKIAQQFHLPLFPVSSGKVDEGNDFGSRNVSFLRRPRIALINGDGVSPTAFGELWHYFEQDISYPVEVIHTQYLPQVDLSEYDRVILPSGSYTKFEKQLYSYLESGGKILAMERAISLFTHVNPDEGPRTKLGEALAKLNRKENEEARENPGVDRDHFPYDQRIRERLKRRVVGSIFEVTVDATHPMGYGIQGSTFLLKRNSTTYPFLAKNGWNVGVFQGDAHRSGFTGSELRKDLENTLAFGVEPIEKGSLTYFVDSPIIRQFWYSGKLLLGNAVFFD